MKYIVVLGDGMADEPIPALGGKTPLDAAVTPVLDELAGKGTLGTVQNVPAGMAPGSDVANLSVLGYDPAANYSGRSPLEALSVGVQMEDDDVIFRSNIVTLTEPEPYAQKTILDHSSGEISTADADILMDAIRAEFNNDTFRFYTGTSYRHILVWKHGRVSALEPPHDHLGKVIGDYLPQEKVLRDMMERSFDTVIGGSPYADGVLIEKDGEPAGYGLISLTYSGEVGGLCVLLEEIYIREEFRGGGLGKEFFAWAEGEYPQARRFRLEATPSNQRAMDLYRRLGFEPLHYVQMVRDRTGE